MDTALIRPLAPAIGHAEPEPAVAYPGRWIGGLLGAVASLVSAVVLTALQYGTLGIATEGVAVIGVLGIPIGFVVGRALLPMARGGGWQRAASVGLLLGWIAPPLGAVEILAIAGVAEGMQVNAGCGAPPAVGYLALLPLAIPVSFVAVLVTLPVGLLWALLVRAVPDGLLRRLRMPWPIDALGARHLAVLLAIAWTIAVLAQLAATAPCPASPLVVGT